MKRLNFRLIGLWILLGLYGILFNITYIDEAKYLIKGWLMTTGQVGYYSTPEFFYQHLPGSLLWYGSGQALFGPNLLIARIQSFVVGILLLLFTAKLAQTINPKTNAIRLLLLAPIAILYYSSAVPQSLAALTLILAFYCLFKKQDYWATVWFSLTFIVRENFLFTLIFYQIYQRNFRHLFLSLAIGAVFFLPGWPGTINVLKNFPLDFQPEHSLNLYLQAGKEFLLIYSGFIVVFMTSLKFWRPLNRQFVFLCFIAGFNFLAHAWSAFNLSPRSLVPYFAYTLPLFSVIAAVNFAGRKIKFYPLLLFLALTCVPLASLFRPPSQTNTISELSRSAKNLRPLVADKQKIIWIAEPMSLYLAGRTSYYPLINHTNFYRPTAETKAVKAAGWWNEDLLNSWLQEADLLVADPNRLNFAGINLEENLNHAWIPIDSPVNIWPEKLKFYLPKSSFTTFPEASPLEK